MTPPMRVLPVLEGRRAALETCVYCPKLSRAACPVSNAEPRETLTPWGKMSTAFFLARGDVPLDASHGATAWACTGCYACRERCDHRNEVAPTLFDARAELLPRGAAPEAASRVVARFEERGRALAEAVQALSQGASVEPLSSEGRALGPGEAALLVGCGYARHLPDEARAAVAAAQALSGRRVRPVERCCGLPLLQAGDRAGFERSAEALGREARGAVLVADPGCALALRNAGVKVTLLVELAAEQLGRLRQVPSEGPIRYHDPCQLGRGLGLYEAPRAVLGRALGRAVDEFDERREGAVCSGAGGMLPASMPEVSRVIGAARAAAHGEQGGGEIVTACASSLRAFRRAGARASDLSVWIARALGLR